MTNEIKLNLSAADVQEVKRAIDMGLGLQIGLQLGANVTVSAGSAIDGAISASSSQTLWVPTDTNTYLNGVSDGGAVTTMSSVEGLAPTGTGATWNETAGMLDMTGSASSVSVPIGAGFAASAMVCMVVNTTDNSAIMVGDDVSSQAFAGIFQDGSSSTALVSDTVGTIGNAGTARVFVDGVEQTGTRDQFHAVIADGSDHVLTIRNANFSNVTTSFVLGKWAGFSFDGLMGDFLVVDDQGDAVQADVEAELAARHGITL